MAEPVLLDLCGRRPDQAVQAVVALWRAFWTSAVNRTPGSADELSTSAILPAPVVRDALRKELVHPSSALRLFAPDAIDCLCDGLLAPFVLEDRPEALYFRDVHFCAFELVSFLLGPIAVAADLNYLTARDLRRRNGVSLSAAAMRAFQVYTNRLRSWIASLAAPLQKHQHFGMLLLKAQLDEEQKQARPEEISPDAYLELVSAMGWVWPDHNPGELRIELHRFDTQDLAGRYFGFPTAIPGFDSIFAGAGPLIVDAPASVDSADVPPLASAQPIGGRTVLLVGPYGTGKSTLTLQIAIEVARKGGVAIVAAMEQTAEECIYAMEALGVPTRSDAFDVVDEMRAAMPRLSRPYDGRGVLAFLPIQRSPIQRSAVKTGGDESSELETLLHEVSDRLTWMHEYPLRMLIVDPLNSVLEDGPDRNLKTRKKLVALFQEAKRRGVNIWLTTERNRDQMEETLFDENIADTVLHLSVDRTAQYQRRTIEVRKSRLQRDEPGRHSLMILPQSGVEIYPSSTSIARNILRNSVTPAAPKPTRFNVEGLDRILGPNGLLKGDVIGLNGAPGSSRTIVGVHFLCGVDPSDDGSLSAATSLFISDSTEDKLQCLVESVCENSKSPFPKKGPADIRLCPILPG